MVMLASTCVEAQHDHHDHSTSHHLVSGSVVDASTGLGVPLAAVIVESSGTGVACDDQGFFRLEIPDGPQTLRISALGFTSERVELDGPPDKPLFVQVHPRIQSYDEVVVTGSSTLIDDPAAPPIKMNSTEDLLDRVAGADFYHRGNFAWEPVVRGLSGGQLGVVIDGMQVVGACVDKMDPTSAYVEVENLRTLELSKGGFDLSEASQIAGTVNYVTEQPRFDNTYYSKVDVGMESVSGLMRTALVAGVSRGGTSVRGSFSYKNAGDYTPGGGSEPVEDSGYKKNNFKLDVAQKLGSGHQLTGSILADNAWDVGYPVLLMDATLAQARIYSLTHLWDPGSTVSTISGWETRAYYNSVDHYMDDYKRDVMQREVMRGMNMPMFGQTRTAGGMSRMNLRSGVNELEVTVDLYRTESFGDMWMFSLFDIPDMYLLNLGDVVVKHGAVSANLSRPLGSRFRTRIDARFDYSPRDVEDERARAILAGRWETDDLARTYAFGNLSGTVEYLADPTTRFRLALAHVGRLPTHVENYGHYIYNYVDGYFYTGNPNLDHERSSQVELGMERWTAGLGLKASLYANYIKNLIVGASDDGLVGGSDVYQFRYYRNADNAMMLGGELSAVYRLPKGLELAGSASYTWGQNLELDEPMYLMPPLTGLVALRFKHDRFFGEVETRMAAPQNRVSTMLSDEQPTDGYMILNLRGSARLGEYLELTAGLENVFDVLYHEHLSYGDLPAKGRNAFIGLNVTI